MKLVFFTIVPIREKIIFSNLIFLVLPFQKVEMDMCQNFGVPIFNLALVVIKWPHLAGSIVGLKKNEIFVPIKYKVKTFKI